MNKTKLKKKTSCWTNARQTEHVCRAACGASTSVSFLSSSSSSASLSLALRWTSRFCWGVGGVNS